MAEPLRDPKKLQAQVEEFQRAQHQLSIISSQRQQVLMQIEELKMAKEYLKDSKQDAQIYKAIGNLMVQTGKKEADKELGSKIETFEVREKSMKKHEESLKGSLEKMRSVLQKATSQS